MSLVAVVIPVYKSIPSEFELRSFEQCIKVLNKHPVSLVCPDTLDVSFYKSIASKNRKQITVRTFNECNFSSTQSYNKLLLSANFYKSFKDFRYILLYQLDAWVFRDELEYWCHKGYDYIGAPWFENFGSHEQGYKLWTVGNGGFSLRRISSFIKIFRSLMPFYSHDDLMRTYPTEVKFEKKVKRILMICIKSVGVKNNTRYFIKKYTKNEDLFWCLFYQNSHKSLNIPTCEISIDFSFERSPKYLYEKNGSSLPFGCHAWEKYEYDSFWIDFIPNNTKQSHS